MRRGKSHRPHQFPPYWKGSESIASKPPASEVRRQRHAALGWNPHYEYSVGQNMIFVTGRCTRSPKVSGFKDREMVWFRVCVPNFDNPGQKLFVPVRSRGALAIHAYENVMKGDDVAVVGRLWSGKMYRPMRKGQNPQWRQFTFIDAERISSAYPIQLESDPRYIRVRIDLWNRMCCLAPDMQANDVPARRRADLVKQWEDVARWYAGFEPNVDDDEGDPDPSAQREPHEHEDSVGDPGG